MKTRLLLSFILVFLTAFIFLITPESARAASCTWFNGSGNWNDSSHWNCGHVPISGEDATISDGSTVTVTSNASVGSLTLSNGTLSINASITLTANSFSLTGGVVNGAGDLTADTINWTYGSMQGSGSTTATSYLNFTGAENVQLYDRTFNNAGIALWNKTGSLTLNGSAHFNNQAGASFTVQSSGATLINGDGTINNAGAFTKTNAGNADINLIFNNLATGTVSVEAGMLEINNHSGTTSSGTYDVHTGKTLRLSGTHNLSGSVNCTGDGTIEVNGYVNIGGSFTCGGTTSIISTQLSLTSGTATANLNILNMSNGILTGAGALTADTINWTYGSMQGSGSTTATSHLNFTSTENVQLYDRTFNNAGIALWNKTGSLTLNAPAHFNNQAGASFTVQPSAGTIIINGDGTFTNSGTLNLTTGSFNTVTFTQEAGGITNLAIKGTIPVTDYCQLNSTYINLAGPLNISFTGVYVPHIGDQFTLLIYGSTRTGDYSSVNVEPLAHGYPIVFYQDNRLHLWLMERVLIPMITNE